MMTGVSTIDKWSLEGIRIQSDVQPGSNRRPGWKRWRVHAAWTVPRGADSWSRYQRTERSMLSRYDRADCQPRRVRAFSVLYSRWRPISQVAYRVISGG